MGAQSAGLGVPSSNLGAPINLSLIFAEIWNGKNEGLPRASTLEAIWKQNQTSPWESVPTSAGLVRRGQSGSRFCSRLSPHMQWGYWDPRQTRLNEERIHNLSRQRGRLRSAYLRRTPRLMVDETDLSSKLKVAGSYPAGVATKIWNFSQPEEGSDRWRTRLVEAHRQLQIEKKDYAAGGLSSASLTALCSI